MDVASINCQRAVALSGNELTLNALMSRSQDDKMIVCAVRNFPI